MDSGNDLDAAARERVGQIVEKYRLLRVLGYGGMGAVYEAEHELTGKRVALKMMHSDLARSSEYAGRFMREARAASSIGHPGIVDVLDAGKLADGSLFIVMELLRGQDLTKAITEGSLSRADVVGLAVQVLEALSAAHARGIVHRDVKPENIFITKDGKGRLRAKLLDFGVAKHKPKDFGPSTFRTRMGTVVGTPHFMSPEQASGQNVDGRADVWSVGATLYHAFAGHPPFDADNYAMLLVQILTAHPPPLAAVCGDLPEGIASVVHRALSKPIEERWESASAMADALVAASTGMTDRPLGIPKSDLPPAGATTTEGPIDPASGPDTPTRPARPGASEPEADDEPIRVSIVGSDDRNTIPEPLAAPVPAQSAESAIESTSWPKGVPRAGTRWVAWVALAAVAVGVVAVGLAASASGPATTTRPHEVRDTASTTASDTTSPARSIESARAERPAPPSTATDPAEREPDARREPPPEAQPSAQPTAPPSLATPAAPQTARSSITADAGARSRTARNPATRDAPREGARPARGGARWGSRDEPVEQYE